MKRLLPLLILSLTACVPPPAPPLQAPPPQDPFRAEEFAWSTTAGRNSISGAVGYRPAGAPKAKAWTCAGGSVGLTPETGYSRRRVYNLYGSIEEAAVPVGEVRSRTIAEPAEDYNRFVRAAQCDSLGRFTFAGLPDGAWYLIAVARPTPGSAPENAMALMRRVETRGGRPLLVMLD